MQYKIQLKTLRITVPGDILSTGVRDLRAQLQAILETPDAVQSGWQTLELDLTNAKMIDSMGLNLLVGVLKQVKERGGKMRLDIRDANLDRLLRFTRIHEHVEVVRA